MGACVVARSAAFCFEYIHKQMFSKLVSLFVYAQLGTLVRTYYWPRFPRLFSQTNRNEFELLILAHHQLFLLIIPWNGPCLDTYANFIAFWELRLGHFKSTVVCEQRSWHKPKKLFLAGAIFTICE